MRLADSPREAAYRAAVRAWLAGNVKYAPPERGVRNVRDSAPFRAWQRRLHDAGFVAITWPVEHGGQGLGAAEQAVCDSELVRSGVPGPFDMVGTAAVGPTIIEFGSTVQKGRYLEPILCGDEVWCQLFTEWDAGSDLAAVRTVARPHPDGWEITGQKVWTTNAQHADFGLVLARTDADVPKHRGLTVLVVPMRVPGVKVRPLRQMSGNKAFNEVALDHVVVGPGAMVGEVGGGWPVALFTLGCERVHLVAGLDRMGFDLGEVAACVADAVEGGDQHTRVRAATVIADLHAVRFGGLRAVSSAAAGAVPNAAFGLGKITAVDAVFRACQLIIEAQGMAAFDGRWGELLAQMPAWRNGGGTHEILLSTVGEQALGLPREPRPPRVPFREEAGA